MLLIMGNAGFASSTVGAVVPVFRSQSSGRTTLLVAGGGGPAFRSPETYVKPWRDEILDPRHPQGPCAQIVCTLALKYIVLYFGTLGPSYILFGYMDP